MPFLKPFFKFYINSSIHVALAVFAMGWITLLEFNLPFDGACLYFIFFASVTGYNFVKYYGLAQFHHKSLTNKLKAIQLFSAVVFFLMLYLFFKLTLKVQFIIVLLGAFTFFYAIPIIPKKYLLDEHKNLRQISGLKIYVIALVWTCVTVILPLQNANYDFNFEVIITLIQRFVYVLVLMLPFEIRDLNFDNLKLATIPQQIGVKKTKVLGCALLVLFFFLAFFKGAQLKGNYILIDLAICVSTFMALICSKQKQSYFYAAFWVESLPIWWWVLWICFS